MDKMAKIEQKSQPQKERLMSCKQLTLLLSLSSTIAFSVISWNKKFKNVWRKLIHVINFTSRLL